MTKFDTQAHIHSLDGAMDTITVLCKEKLFGYEINNSYIVRYKGTLCSAILNPFVNQYYVDDIYGVIDKDNENYCDAMRSI